MAKLLFALLHFSAIPTGIEAQILSQEDIDKGVNVTFPTANANNITVKSEVPSSTISKHGFLDCVYREIN